MARRKVITEDLTTEVIEAFLGATKIVTAPEVRWTPAPNSVDQLRWRVPVEVDSVAVGHLYLSSNTAIERCWNFHVVLHGYPVYGWHFNPVGRHKNWAACDADFPIDRRVRSPHEQIWVPGPGFKCAKPLLECDELTHVEALERFCERARVIMDARYREPEVAEQLILWGEAAK